jgi:hypothetical protein
MNKKLLLQRRFKKGGRYYKNTNTTSKPAKSNTNSNMSFPSANKSNPEVIKNFRQMDYNRKKYDRNFDQNLTNKRYKKIIYDRNIPTRIKNIKDLEIQVDKIDASQFNHNLEQKRYERSENDNVRKKNYNVSKRQQYENDFKYKNEVVYEELQKKRMKHNIPTNFETMKTDVGDHFKKEEDELKRYKDEMAKFMNKF